MFKIYIVIAMSLLLVSCAGSEEQGDVAPEGVPPAKMYDSVTPLGFKIQSNGYDFDPDEIDNTFLETESCLNYSDTPVDIYIILKEAHKAFPCASFPKAGCGGLYAFPIITVSTDFRRLKHEYVHYLLDYHTGNSDILHESPSFDQCS